MRRTTRIHLEYSDEVAQAVDEFGDHEGIREARVLRWLEQFADDDLPLAIDLIRSVKYFGAANIRSMTKQLFRMTTDELVERGYRSAVFVAAGRSGSGAAPVVRVLRELVRHTPHRVVDMLHVAKIAPGEVDAIVFLEDFSGTGDTLVDWWANVESIVRPSNAAIFVGLLILNERARHRIEEFADVLCVTELGPEANVLAGESTTFSEAQKRQLLEYCRGTNCGPRFEQGYGACGLVVALKHGCPNNSLPILWYESGAWHALFTRRAI